MGIVDRRGPNAREDRRRPSTRDVVSFAVFAACVAVAIGRAATAPEPPSARSASAAERRAFAGQVAAAEADWQINAARKFPGDHWSQDDDFHNVEQRVVRQAARQLGVQPSDLLRAIDENLHDQTAQGRSPRRASVVPCKPRPFYD